MVFSSTWAHRWPSRLDSDGVALHALPPCLRSVGWRRSITSVWFYSRLERPEKGFPLSGQVFFSQNLLDLAFGRLLLVPRPSPSAASSRHSAPHTCSSETGAASCRFRGRLRALPAARTRRTLDGGLRPPGGLRTRPEARRGRVAPHGTHGTHGTHDTRCAAGGLSGAGPAGREGRFLRDPVTRGRPLPLRTPRPR